VSVKYLGTAGEITQAPDSKGFPTDGKDERIRVSAFDDGVEFYYRFLKAVTR